MPLLEALKTLLRDIGLFAKHASGTKLRNYQLQVAHAVAQSVIHRHGDTIVVMFPRQSGKNVTQAQIETYLLTLFSQLNGEIVKASPTWKPQSINAMRRLDDVLKKNLLTLNRWKPEAGYARRLETARIYFMSAGPHANSVGHTASVLLECDEAQDVQIAKWDKDFLPMAASTNATRVYWGTAWTSRTLLARELRAARAAEQLDGRRRTFVLTADDVAAEVPAYGKFVQDQVTRLGRQHPLVRTQFFSEEIDAEGGLFPPARRALLWGTHAPQLAPQPGHTYALLLDVAGADETQTTDPTATASRRDTTALTVLDCDLATVADDLIHAPTYYIVARYGWLDVKHSSLYGQIKALAEHWNARFLVIDATGIGAGLASFLAKALAPGVTVPFVFNVKTKSDLGWSFLAAVESGRLKDHADTGDLHQAAFREQLEFVTYEAGENKSLHWSVPNGTHNPATGELIHDDWVLSAALVGVLDEQIWGPVSGASITIHPPDMLEEIRRDAW